jgi:hypothetical protein
MDTPHGLLPTYKRENDLIERIPPPVFYTQPSEYVLGRINPLDKRTITKCLTIDTRFRDNFCSTVSTDFTFQLPMKFNKVVSMKLSSFEIPVAFYGISEYYGNNYLFIAVTYTNLEEGAYYDDEPIIQEKVFIVPDGNYNAPDLVDLLNNLIAPKNPDTGELVEPCNPFSYVLLDLDISSTGCGSGKVTIRPNGAKASRIHKIVLDFRRGKNGIPDGLDYSGKIGWNLGFLNEVYDGNTTYVAETLIDPASIRYLYLVVDDFHNNMNNPFVTAFHHSLMMPNILARISIKGSYFSLLMENDLSVVSEAREYFGPVDIQRLRIQLMDDRGRPINMNGANYSFCLLFKMLYDV